MLCAAHTPSAACPTPSHEDPWGSNAGAHQSQDVSPFGAMPRRLHTTLWVGLMPCPGSILALGHNRADVGQMLAAAQRLGKAPC